jgi:predicted acyltransferase
VARLAATAAPHPFPSRERLVSLDVFRGLTMAAMVVVNNPGDWRHVYAPLLHAPWHGWTPTDLIFPFFLFIVGAAVTLSGRSRGPWGPILLRAGLLLALGLGLAGFPWFDLARWRIPGVLQRIGVCYLGAVAVHRWTSPSRGAAGQIGRLAAVVGALTLGYWGVMTRVPVPGGAPGDLSPDGNLAAFLDRALMGGHLWQRTWDPEGLLSTVPAVATTLLGVMAGRWLEAVPGTRGSRGLALAGAAGVATGLLWDQAFPINKNLWTSSYVLFTGGAAALTLAALHEAIDVRRWRAGTRPFVVLGANAITLFVLSGLLVKALLVVRVTGTAGRQVALSRAIHDTLYAPFLSPEAASLGYALTHLVLLFALLAWMYRRRLFLRV